MTDGRRIVDFKIPAMDPSNIRGVLTTEAVKRLLEAKPGLPKEAAEMIVELEQEGSLKVYLDGRHPWIDLLAI